jgi:peptidyl-prolyl cis-trans isomerase A (cyclophilin A)
MIFRRIHRGIFIYFVFLVLSSCGTRYPHVLIITEIGTIELEIYNDKAPITANNFLQYVKERRYKGATFYRSVRVDNQPGAKDGIEVVQGGLFEDEHPAMLPPIVHESTKLSGIRHTNGVISMARYEPGTATSEFFICIGPQPTLDYGGSRNPDGQGFAAFGKVVDGIEIVEQIHQMPTDGQYLKPGIRILDVILK